MMKQLWHGAQRSAWLASLLVLFLAVGAQAANGTDGSSHDTLVMVTDGSGLFAEAEDGTVRGEQVLVELLAADEQLAVIAFDGPLRTLVGPAVVGPPAERDVQQRLLATLTPGQPGDLPGALSAAYGLIRAQGEGAAGTIVLFTGDEADGGAVSGTALEGAWTVAHALGRRGIVLHILDRAGPTGELEALARLTGGLYRPTGDAPALLAALAELTDGRYGRLRLLPDTLTGNVGEEGAVHFRVPEGVDELHITGADAGEPGLPLELVAPDGGLHALNAGRGESGIGLPVWRHADPQPGTWQLVLPDPAASPPMLSAAGPVRLFVAEPGWEARRHPGESLTAAIFLAGGELPAGWRVEALVRPAGGESGEAGQPVRLTPAGGADDEPSRLTASLVLPGTVGRQLLAVRIIDGTSAVAERVMPVTVGTDPRLVLETGLAPEATRIGDRVGLTARFETAGETAPLQLLSAELWLHGTQGGGSVQALVVEPGALPVLHGDLLLEQGGEHRITVVVRGLYGGEAFVARVQGPPFLVAPPSTVAWRLDTSPLRSLVPGREVSLPVLLTTDGSGAQPVTLFAEGEHLVMEPLTVEASGPGGRWVSLPLQVAPGAEVGGTSLRLFAVGADGATIVAPASMAWDARIVHPWLYHWYRWPWLSASGYAAAAAAVLYLSVGAAVYWRRRRPRTLAGSLIYTPLGGGGEVGTLELSALKRARAVVAAGAAQRRTQAARAGAAAGPGWTVAATERLAVGLGLAGEGRALARGGAGGRDPEQEKETLAETGLDLLAKLGRRADATESGAAPDAEGADRRPASVEPEPGHPGSPAGPKADAGEHDAAPGSADLVLPTRGRPFRFALQYVLPEPERRWYAQGWEYLFRGGPEQTLQVAGEGRTRIQLDGFIRVQAPLSPGDSFRVGGYRFTYQSPIEETSSDRRTD